MNAPWKHARTGAVLALGGFLLWAVFAAPPALGGRGFVEAWDVRAYWTAGLPALALVHAAAGYAGRSALLRLPLWALGGHAAAMLLLHRAGADAGLVPLAILLTGAPLYGLLLAAAWLGRQMAEFRATA